ncbi:poly a -specific ribonuclease/target of egr1 member 1 [Anaeramoeba ignava]|uniref:Poly a -specific ribonuclease/target of egr1 member 1 n=1 Tax=Anaeramoeba ignava TaxID=1746090 RepID=A0A9Q0L7C4_ANAIG|nr:poly a -specific ribonuclease/target of egr1 member 1 [Anaeramoeba ignava]
MKTTFSQVNKKNINKKAIEIRDCLKNEELEFISFDTEFSGGLKPINLQNKPEEIHAEYISIAKSFALLQVGISFFFFHKENKEDTKETRKLYCKTYNFWIIPKKYFKSDTQSLLFLLSHNFSFDKHLEKSIQFLPENRIKEKKEEKEKENSEILPEELLLILMKEIFITKKEKKGFVPIVGHNALYDLYFVYQQLLNDIPDFSSFMKLLDETMPLFFDTKYLSSSFLSIPAFLHLPDVYRGAININKEKNLFEIVEMETNTSYHDAGYDSYVTGFSFAIFRELISKENLKKSTKHFFFGDFFFQDKK